MAPPMNLRTRAGNVVSVKVKRGCPLRPKWERDPTVDDLKELAVWLFRIQRPGLNLRQRAAAAEDQLQAWRSHAHDLRRQLAACEIRAMRLEDEKRAVENALFRAQEHAGYFQQQLLERSPAPQPQQDRSEPVEIKPERQPPAPSEPGYPRWIENPTNPDHRVVVRSARDHENWLKKWNTTAAAATAAASGHHEEALALHAAVTPPPPPPTWKARVGALFAFARHGR